jgi:hypothetical protein
MKTILLFGLFIFFLVCLGLIGSLVAFLFAGAGFSLAILLERHPMQWARYGFVIGVVVYIWVKLRLAKTDRQ